MNKQPPADLKKSVGVIFVFCGAIMPFWTVGDAGPYKEKSNFLMRTSPSAGSYFLYKFTVFPSVYPAECR